MAICPVCENVGMKNLIKLKYIGVSTHEQSLKLCPRCGLICSKEKFGFEYNIMSSEKDSYLEQRINDFLASKLKLLEVNEFDFELSHIKQVNGNVGTYNDRSNGKKIQMVSEHLEHETDLRRTIATLAKKQTEYVFVETPIYDFFSNDSVDLFGYFIKSHNYYYSFDTIKKMMNMLGYTLLNLELVPGNGFHMPMIFPCILSLWGKTPKTDIQISFHSDINAYIRECKKAQCKMNQKIDKLFEGGAIFLLQYGEQAIMQRSL